MRLHGDEIEPLVPEAVVLFDGDCNLCNHAVQFILRRDPQRRFQFAALQSSAARRLLELAGQTPEQLPDSVVLVEQGRIMTRSTAALRIARHLTGLWPLLIVLMIVPRPIRDWGYDLIAKNRVRWFGRGQSCMLATPEIRARFLSD